MKMFRRMCALGAVGAVTAGMLAGVAATTVASSPAAADTPEVYAATANATALKLSLFGNNLTVSSTNVEGDSSAKAHANGSGIGLIAATASSADASGANDSQTPPKACGLNLPIANLVNIAVACSQSTSATVDGAPAAQATSSIAAIDVNLLNPVLNLLQPILNQLLPLANQLVGSVLTTVQTTVQPLLGNLLPTLLGKLGVTTASPVSDLITALKNATNLATIHVGDTKSAIATSAGAVTADSDAQGATVDVLPGLLVGGGSLLTVTVGKAHTTSTFDRAAGASSATFDPAILTVTLLGSVIPIKLGSPVTLLAGTPLESTISLGGGASSKKADGSVSAVADGVGLDLLKGINGGISLHLAHAESAAGGTKAFASPVTTTTSTTLPTTLPVVTSVEQVRLATTGTSAPLLPIGFFLVLAGYVTRRGLRYRRSARASRSE